MPNLFESGNTSRQIQERRLYQAKIYAQLDKNISASITLETLNSLPFAGRDLAWTACCRETGFTDSLEDLFRMGCMGHFDPVVLLAIKLRCFVFGKASEEDFSAFNTEENDFRFGADWSLFCEDLDPLPTGGDRDA